MRHEVVYRRRVPADIPALVSVLAEQQSASRYPFGWPLPFPAEQFVARTNQLAGWTAQVNGQPSGHVGVQSVSGGASSNGDAETGLVEAWSRGHGRPLDKLAAISSLFVATRLRNLGIGMALLNIAVEWTTRRGLSPCLDVLQGPGPAADICLGHGWQTVAELRPRWLPDDHPPLLAMIHPSS